MFCNRSLLFAAGLMLLLLSACAAPPLTPVMPTSSPEFTDNISPATSTPAATGMADVLFVKAVQAQDGAWTFSVTVSHPDTGWEDYADGWDVLTPDGQVIKTDPNAPFTRLLLHPHVNEQPFTRSQSGIRIPPGIRQVMVRAHSLQRGFGGRQVQVDLDKTTGDDFEVRAR